MAARIKDKVVYTLRKAKARFALVNKYRKLMREEIEREERQGLLHLNKTVAQYDDFVWYSREVETSLGLDCGIWNLSGDTYEPYSQKFIKQVLTEYHYCLCANQYSERLWELMDGDSDSDLTYFFTGVPHCNYDDETAYLILVSLYGKVNID
jgi:hypothetical protein